MVADLQNKIWHRGVNFLLAIFQSKLARQIGAAAFAVLAFVTFSKIQKRKGAKQERDKADAAINKARNEAHETVDDINEDIGAMQPSDVKRLLGEKYRRD